LPLYVAMGAAGEGARASRVHDSAEFGVLAMTMWRFDPGRGRSGSLSLAASRESARGYGKKCVRAPTIGQCGPY
jgi:hypothetical protein